ncbi:MAG: metal ABC transporter permease [Natronospirillum sp.]|uniref:metal ABC transporter permease n=1 Tax=Natronospirillum sp. TaxID=2812955 RepID=UPI0025E6F66B|nr:metal ABC transporter permease [Natronospirillum sp.]MCH8551629.1 metal ABC transporter permease [Natronospirillum sp.]
MTELWVLPLLAGCGLMLLAAPLGSLLVWQRMAFFADALAHASLLGVGIGLLFFWAPLPGALFGTLLFALLLWRAEQVRSLAADTWLGVLSHGSLALGLLLVYGYAPPGINLSALLIGDVLGVTHFDLWALLVVLVLGLTWLVWRWKALMLSVLSPDLAQAEGINLNALRGQFMVLLAAVVALAIQWVGVLLISSLMLIPAAAARGWSREPEQMVFSAAVIGMLSVGLGIAASWHWDWPTGPAIVVVALGLFAISLAVARLQKRL